MEKELVEFVVKSLVDAPDEVSVNVIEGEKSTILELKVAQEDVGNRQAGTYCKSNKDYPFCICNPRR